MPTLRRVFAFIPAAILIVASGTVSPAATILETMSGVIVQIGGNATDNLGLFGGSVALGDPASVSFSYDLSTLGGHSGDGLSYEQYLDVHGESNVLGSVTINSQTFQLTNSAYGGAGEIRTNADGSGEDLTAFIADGGTYFQVIVASSSGFAAGQMDSQASMDAIIAGATQIIVYEGVGYASENPMALSLGPGTPEPASWILAGGGLSALALLCVRARSGRKTLSVCGSNSTRSGR